MAERSQRYIADWDEQSVPYANIVSLKKGCFTVCRTRRSSRSRITSPVLQTCPVMLNQSVPSVRDWSVPYIRRITHPVTYVVRRAYGIGPFHRQDYLPWNVLWMPRPFLACFTAQRRQHGVRARFTRAYDEWDAEQLLVRENTFTAKDLSSWTVYRHNGRLGGPCPL